MTPVVYHNPRRKTVMFNEGGRWFTLSVAYGARFGVRAYVLGRVFTLGPAFRQPTRGFA